MFNIKITGLNELEKKFDDMRKKLKTIEGNHKIPMSEIFNDKFMKENTKFDSLDQLFKVSGYTVETNKDFEDITDDKWDDFIKNNTKYLSWKEMQTAAIKKYVSNKVKL